MIHSSESGLPRDQQGRRVGKIIGESSGATKGFCLGISYYDALEFPQPGVHDDQEALFILEGTGVAGIGQQEFPVRPGVGIYVGPGVPHTIKRDASSGPVKVLWTHGAI